MQILNTMDRDRLQDFEQVFLSLFSRLKIAVTWSKFKKLFISQDHSIISRIWEGWFKSLKVYLPRYNEHKF